ncbi:MAG: hypothetical protein HYX92_05810 [Chloroflexi bacterium]|nr:hypothetical protein [Chloroflexota bacterium]
MVTDKQGKVHFEVANPVAEVRPEAIMPARRLDTFSGKRIALWWNTKSHGEIALSAAAEAVERRFQNVTFVRFTRPMECSPGPYEDVVKAQCDAVIASTGD